jgi:hypothetical protein
MTDATKTDFTDSMGDVPFMDRVAMRTRGKYVVELAHGFKPDPDGDGYYHEVPCARVIVHEKGDSDPYDYWTIGAERYSREDGRTVYDELTTKDAIAAWAAKKETLTGV